MSLEHRKLSKRCSGQTVHRNHREPPPLPLPECCSLNPAVKAPKPQGRSGPCRSADGEEHLKWVRSEQLGLHAGVGGSI